MSHPTGVRGLKYVTVVSQFGGVHVAPHWGAWIEIIIMPKSVTKVSSHPTGVRGLKYRCCEGTRHASRRTPLGCVD